MQGRARTTNFILGVAEVMLGPAQDLFSLTPNENSIGLVKALKVSVEPGNVPLPRGLRAMSERIIHSGLTLRAEMQLYEFTPRNAEYASGLQGTTASEDITRLSNTIVSADTVIDVDDSSSFSSGGSLMIETDDIIVTRKIQNITDNQITLVRPVGVDFPAQSKVTTASEIQPTAGGSPSVMSARIIGRLANGTPIEIQFPRVNVTSGFSLQFGTEDFGTIPLSFDCFESRPGDPLFSDFARTPGKVFVGSRYDSLVSSGLGSVFWDNFTTWDNFMLWK